MQDHQRRIHRAAALRRHPQRNSTMHYVWLLMLHRRGRPTCHRSIARSESRRARSALSWCTRNGTDKALTFQRKAMKRSDSAPCSLGDCDISRRWTASSTRKRDRRRCARVRRRQEVGRKTLKWQRAQECARSKLRKCVSCLGSTWRLRLSVGHGPCADAYAVLQGGYTKFNAEESRMLDGVYAESCTSALPGRRREFRAR
jgi:hypothetical protein